MLIAMSSLFSIIISSVSLILLGSRCVSRSPEFENETRQLIERMLVADMIDRERAAGMLKQHGVAGDVGMKIGTPIGADVIRATLVKPGTGFDFPQLGDKLVQHGLRLGASGLIVATVVLGGWMNPRKRIESEPNVKSQVDGPVQI